MDETQAPRKKAAPTKGEFIAGLPKPSKDEFIFLTGHGMKKHPFPAGMLRKVIADPVHGDRDQFARYMEKLADPSNTSVISVIDSGGEIKAGSEIWKDAVKRIEAKKIEIAKNRKIRADPWSVLAKILERSTA